MAQMANIHNPLDQFLIKKIIPIEVAGLDVSFTNASLFMIFCLLTAMLFFFTSLRKRDLVPTRLQSAAEALYEMAEGMVTGSAGDKAKRYVPYIFTLFLFILICNLMGMLPYSYTVTSHFAVTFALSMTVFIAITIIGFVRHGLHYLSLFLPQGTPMVMAPLIIFIEFFAYLVRPVSLSLRLTANMMAGHIVLKVLASFVIMAGVVGIFPLALLTILIGFEIFIAVLQAYIFAILTCAYLNDAVNLH
jgi:F-type H+-transporting ATPase subunit a